ncbi:MAG TPA: quaternary ammonium compound efflux SMR transporter SugE [Terriglobia bacterium]|nr:quaternary ammonium compound efflux SMR transporter SugE [Terriglobia bacterium]
MAWTLLIIAGLFEVAWALGLKYTEGFTRLIPSLLTIAGMAASMILLARASRHLPIGTAYAVWTGIGAVGAVIGGIFLFGESRNWARVICIALILAGVAGLRFLHE